MHMYLFVNSIDEDKIESLSICFVRKDEDKWTKAMKYLLIDLKWCLAFVTLFLCKGN